MTFNFPDNNNCDNKNGSVELRLFCNDSALNNLAHDKWAVAVAKFVAIIWAQIGIVSRKTKPIVAEIEWISRDHDVEN